MTQAPEVGPWGPRSGAPAGPSPASSPGLRLKPSGLGLPGVITVILLGLAFIAQIQAGEAALSFGVSGQAIAEGRWWTPLTAIFLHGGALHLFMNSLALLSLAPPVAAGFARSPAGLLGWFGYFLACGVAGSLAFLAADPQGVTPAVGASGAICGLWGAAVRIGARLQPTRGKAMGLLLRESLNFAAMNLILVLLATSLSGGIIAIAWTAHLGGYVFGFLTAPRVRRDALAT